MARRKRPRGAVRPRSADRQFESECRGFRDDLRLDQIGANAGDSRTIGDAPEAVGCDGRAELKRRSADDGAGLERFVKIARPRQKARDVRVGPVSDERSRRSYAKPQERVMRWPSPKIVDRVLEEAADCEARRHDRRRRGGGDVGRRRRSVSLSQRRKRRTENRQRQRATQDAGREDFRHRCHRIDYSAALRSKPTSRHMPFSRRK